MTCYHRITSAFTLVELIVVISIIVFLSGMLMPLMSMAKRSSMRTVSLATMGKTEAALYQFKADYRAYPYQLAYNQDGEPWSNNLGYTIGTDISAADTTLVKADMQAAALDYSYDISSGNLVPSTIHTFTNNRGNGFKKDDGSGDPEGDPAPAYPYQPNGHPNWYWSYPGASISICVLLNRLATERANEIILAGDVTAGGVVMQPILGPGGLNHHGRDLHATPLLAHPQSLNQPGWAKDYLQGQIASKYLRGGSVLDAYLHPLIYVCQVVPGSEVDFGPILNSYVDINNTANYGLAPIGRKTLAPFIPGTSTAISGDPLTFPDTSNFMHSDLRYWAAPGYELEFELWSAGADGQMGWWRDDPLNKDNIPCEPYNKNLGAAP